MILKLETGTLKMKKGSKFSFIYSISLAFILYINELRSIFYVLYRIKIFQIQNQHFKLNFLTLIQISHLVSHQFRSRSKKIEKKTCFYLRRYILSPIIPNKGKPLVTRSEDYANDRGTHSC